MKKLTSLILITLIGVTVWGQSTIDRVDGGNPNILFKKKGVETGNIYSGTFGGFGFTFKPTGWLDSSKDMVIDDLGRVGILKQVPTEALDVNGAIKISNKGTGYRKGLFLYTNSVATGDNTGIDFCTSTAANITSARIEAERVSGGFANLNFKTFKPGANNNHVLSSVLFLSCHGNVGIGTTTPGNYKLAVEGIIGAREVKVTTDAWADFVFEDDYQLKDLSEVEVFINENNHLPDIPSAKEVMEEGIALGEMDAKLLQKIEELTLYAIEKEKEVQELKAEVKELQEARSTESEARNSLEQRLAKIEALLISK